MNARSEALFGLLAALLILFSALVDPLVSASIAVILLIIFSIYKYVSSQNT